MKLSKLSGFLLFLVLIGIGLYWKNETFSPSPINNEFSLPEPYVNIPSVTTPPDTPRLYAKYACVMDSDSGRILYGKKENSKAAMASTTKIMTSLLVLESGRMDEIVTASAYASSMPKVHLGMRKGYQYKMSDLLFSLMLESHNDTAVAIAEHMAGSVENFAQKMNEKAQKIGMKNTHFVTPNGLDAEGHYSTASDMCKLAAYAIKNKEFCSLIQTKTQTITTIDGKHTYSLYNRDAFLSYYEGALGIKTGFTGDAGYCFVGAAKRNNITLVSCVLASGWPPDKNFKWTDTKSLMDFGMNHFSHFQFPIQDLSKTKIPVEDGKTAYLSCEQIPSLHTLLGKFENIKVIYDLPQKLYAPVRKDIAIGTISFYINDILYKKEEVFPAQSIEKSNFSDTIRNVFDLCLETFFGQQTTQNEF